MSRPESATVKSRPSGLVRPIVLVGLMGAGKTSIGRRLGHRLGVPFRDSDDAIVEAADMSIADIFESYGEPSFRELERRVIARLLTEEGGVLALGGGAFIDPQTRALVKCRAVSIWLDAELDLLVERTARKPGKRPLLMNGEPRAVLGSLMSQRNPIYAEADHRVQSKPSGPDALVDEIVSWLRAEGHWSGAANER